MPRGPMGKGANSTDKAKDFKGAMKRLFSELKIFKGLISISFILAILGAGISIVSPNILSKLTDEINKGLYGVMDMEAIKKIAITLSIMYLLSTVFEYIQSFAMPDVSNKFAKSLRSRISMKINNLPLRYFDLHTKGDILSRVTNDVDLIAQSMNQSLASLVISITLFLGSAAMMFYTNWIMALTAIFASIIGFVIMFIILREISKILYCKTNRARKIKWAYRGSIFWFKCSKSI